MKEKQFENWSKTRSKGKLKFVLLRGLIAWGVPMFLVMTFIVNQPETGEISLEKILIHALIWAVAGLCFGYVTWVWFDKLYLKELEKREHPQTGS